MTVLLFLAHCFIEYDSFEVIVLLKDTYKGYEEDALLKAALKELNKSNQVSAIIETASGKRNKYKYDSKLGVFKLHGVLPFGFIFPFHFGYIPSTLGEDEDPLDILVLMDEPSFCGCLVPCHLIGVITAHQSEKGSTFRNDRLIAVSIESHEYRNLKSMKELNAKIIQELEYFFVSYNEIRGKRFKPLERSSPAKAKKLVKKGFEYYRQKHIEI